VQQKTASSESLPRGREGVVSSDFRQTFVVSSVFQGQQNGIGILELDRYIGNTHNRGRL